MRMFLVCLLLGCGSTVTEPAPADPEPAADDPSLASGEYMPGVPRYPNARYLCWQHVTGQGGAGHITWQGYATSDDLATVRAFYEGRVAPPVTFEPDGEAFRLRHGTDHVVSGHVAGSGHPTCDVAHGPNDRTYLVVSSIAR